MPFILSVQFAEKRQLKLFPADKVLPHECFFRWAVGTSFPIILKSKPDHHIPESKAFPMALVCAHSFFEGL